MSIWGRQLSGIDQLFKTLTRSMHRWASMSRRRRSLTIKTTTTLGQRPRWYTWRRVEEARSVHKCRPRIRRLREQHHIQKEGRAWQTNELMRLAHTRRKPSAWCKRKQAITWRSLQADLVKNWAAKISPTSQDCRWPPQLFQITFPATRKSKSN